MRILPGKMRRAEKIAKVNTPPPLNALLLQLPVDSIPIPSDLTPTILKSWVKVRFIYIAPRLPYIPPQQRCRHRQSRRTAIAAVQAHSHGL